MELTVQNVYGLLLRSQLLGVEEARAMYARWQEEAKDGAGNLARFAAWMVAEKYVTEYQASLLARGHAEGFYLNEYVVLDRLGKGRMAGVYKARHRLGQVVAIKVLPPSKAKDPGQLARFKREARLAIRLKHPNVVRTFQMGTADDLHYLVMEHLEGETLEEVLLRRKKFSAAEAVRIVYQALQGLQHIHEQGLVHRDLKPANLMLVPPPGSGSAAGCTVKILDIGLGRVLSDEVSDGADPGLTEEGVLLGTPDYMAPEQARDPRQSDIRSDVYSLGCVLYHLLAGTPPFPDTNIISQMIRHATEPARALAEFNPEVPDGLQQIVNWMMAKDPAGRYPTPGRAAQALEVFLAAGGGPLSSPDFDPEMKSYLTWLEKENEKGPPPSGSAIPASVVPAAPQVHSPQGAAGRPPSGTMPAAPDKPKSQPAQPAAPAEKAAAARPASSRKDRAGREERHNKKKKRPPELPPARDRPPEPALVDVELVTPPPRAAEEGVLGTLSRRDLVMFFAGVASGLLAYFIGLGLAALFRSRIHESEPEEENDNSR